MHCVPKISNMFTLQAIFQHKQCYKRRLRGVAGQVVVNFIRAGNYVGKPGYLQNAQGGIDSLTVVFSVHSDFRCA